MHSQCSTRGTPAPYAVGWSGSFGPLALLGFEELTPRFFFFLYLAALHLRQLAFAFEASNSFGTEGDVGVLTLGRGYEEGNASASLYCRQG